MRTASTLRSCCKGTLLSAQPLPIHRWFHSCAAEVLIRTPTGELAVKIVHHRVSRARSVDFEKRTVA